VGYGSFYRCVRWLTHLKICSSAVPFDAFKRITQSIDFAQKKTVCSSVPVFLDFRVKRQNRSARGHEANKIITHTSKNHPQSFRVHICKTLEHLEQTLLYIITFK